ncbi:hypothetical protein M23134_00360 [Microscilla marina ATCC 23134]|uniref:Uncharacterized protein n=1 Tax=Microscilla marina ATCC 23134 TaxID=313606 RepID=A2A0B4_MICM2|nr:hypothetical protein M23134_00360 [Microscilla marina ATCC 23134]
MYFISLFLSFVDLTTLKMMLHKLSVSTIKLLLIPAFFSKGSLKSIFTALEHV